MGVDLLIYGNRVIAVALLVLAIFYTRSAYGDSTSTDIAVAGVVPTYFSATLRGQPGDLDLTPRVTVSNRTIALIHFKFNENVQSLVISSSTASGLRANTWFQKKTYRIQWC